MPRTPSDTQNTLFGNWSYLRREEAFVQLLLIPSSSCSLWSETCNHILIINLSSHGLQSVGVCGNDEEQLKWTEKSTVMARSGIPWICGSDQR